MPQSKHTPQQQSQKQQMSQEKWQRNTCYNNCCNETLCEANRCAADYRRVWKYHRGNQNPHIEEEQTTQWPKEKVHTTIHKTYTQN
jgi:hypothetical protein